MEAAHCLLTTESVQRHDHTCNSAYMLDEREVHIQILVLTIIYDVPGHLAHVPNQKVPSLSKSPRYLTLLSDEIATLHHAMPTSRGVVDKACSARTSNVAGFTTAHHQTA